MSEVRVERTMPIRMSEEDKRFLGEEEKKILGCSRGIKFQKISADTDMLYIDPALFEIGMNRVFLRLDCFMFALFEIRLIWFLVLGEGVECRAVIFPSSRSNVFQVDVDIECDIEGWFDDREMIVSIEFYLDGEDYTALCRYEDCGSIATGIIWSAVKEDMKNEDVYYDAENESFYKSVFLGSTLSLCPSGKYYMPFACSNLTPCPDCTGTGKVKGVRFESSGKEVEDIEYECFRCGGSGSHEAHKDQLWYDQLEKECDKHGFWHQSGEGDATDMFICESVDEDDLTDEEKEDAKERS